MRYYSVLLSEEELALFQKQFSLPKHVKNKAVISKFPLHPNAKEITQINPGDTVKGYMDRILRAGREANRIPDSSSVLNNRINLRAKNPISSRRGVSKRMLREIDPPAYYHGEGYQK